MERTFQDIIEMMADAEDYGDLYSAASFIKNQDLRVDVEQMIGEYEDSDTDVETAYSCVTSDLLDSYIYEDNVEDLGDYASFYPKKESKKVTEGIDDKVYQVADLMAEKIRQTGNESISMEEFDEIKSDACKELGVEEYEDLDADLRGVLSYKGFDTDFENGSLLVMTEGKSFKVKVNTPFGQIEVDQNAETQEDAEKEAVKKVKGAFRDNYKEKVKLAETKKVSSEDEAWFEEENDKLARQEIEDKLKDGKQKPDEEIEKEIDKVTEGNDKLNPSAICKWVKESIEYLSKNEAGCCEYPLDEDLSLFCGWLDGYDPEDTDGIHSKSEPTWCINVGIKSNHEYMKTDYDYLTNPYNEETGENWNTDLTVPEGGITESDAQWFIDEYTEIKAALENGEIVLENKKITEGNEIENSEEEDLATMLYAEAMDWASFDRYGECTDFDIQSLEEVRDWYDSTITEEAYNKVAEIVRNTIKNTKYYEDSEGSGTYIELNDNRTMWNINVPEGFDDKASSIFFDETYSMLVQEALKEFEQTTGVTLKLLGRMGRHACVTNNFPNASRYNELKQEQERLEKELIEKTEDYMRASIEESKEIKVEATDTESEFDTFASNLETALRDNGFDAEIIDINDDEGTLDISAEYNDTVLGIMLYHGSEDSAYGYEVDTIGIGGDGIKDVVYPIYREGWDYEMAAPKGSPDVGKEVYAMFKDLKDTSVNEVIEIVKESFKSVIEG